MVGGDQLVCAMVLLTPLNSLLAIVCAVRELVGPVHPVDAGIDVVLIAGTDLKNASNPVIVRLLPGLHYLAGTLLSLNARVVCNVDESFAEILDPINCSRWHPVSSDLGLPVTTTCCTYGRSYYILSYRSTSWPVRLGNGGPLFRAF